MKPTKNRIMCPYAGKPKILFNSKSKALRFIAWNADDIAKERGYSPIRAYYCSGCGGWHVTSQPRHKHIYHSAA